MYGTVTCVTTCISRARYSKCDCSQPGSPRKPQTLSQVGGVWVLQVGVCRLHHYYVMVNSTALCDRSLFSSHHWWIRFFTGIFCANISFHIHSISSTEWFLHRTSSNFLQQLQFGEHKVWQLYWTFSLNISGVVRLHRTSSNFLEQHQCGENKVFDSHEFWLVRVYWTFYIWTYLQGNKVCRVLVYTLVRSGSTASSLLKPPWITSVRRKLCRGYSLEIRVVRLYWTFSMNIFTRGTRCIGYLYSFSLEWFDCIEPPRTYFSAENSTFQTLSLWNMNI